MNTKNASEKALRTINEYLHFRYSHVTVSVPYYNNRHKTIRGGLRGVIGKGSPQDIFDEVEIAMAKDTNFAKGAVKNGSYEPDALTSEGLKQFMVDHDIGIDCSGFVYYILDAEFKSRGKSSLDRYITFPFSKGLFGKIRSKMRPVENAGVSTLAHDKNSSVVDMINVTPGDIITMINRSVEEGGDGRERDHVLFIHQVDYQNFKPLTIHYSHSIAWPSDGVYGHGVRQGMIEIIDIKKPLTEQRWTEADKIGTSSNIATCENYTYARSMKARTQIRRMVSL